MEIIDGVQVLLLGTSAIQNARPLAELAPQESHAGEASMRPHRKRRMEQAVMMQKAETKMGCPREISCSIHLRERARRPPPVLDETQWMKVEKEL